MGYIAESELKNIKESNYIGKVEAIKRGVKFGAKRK